MNIPFVVASNCRVYGLELFALEMCKLTVSGMAFCVFFCATMINSTYILTLSCIILLYSELMEFGMLNFESVWTGNC